MTDVPGPEPVPTDAELDAVRALLGEARVDEPMPPDVASRLDDVLAALDAERATAGVAQAADGTPGSVTPGSHTPAAVVPLHRRWAPRVLVAAAAVVVLGGTAYGVDQIVHSGGVSSGSGSASSAQSERSSGGSSATPPSASGARPPGVALGSLPPLRTAHFAADARRALGGDLSALAAGTADAQSGQMDSRKAAPSSTSAATPSCPGPTRAGTVSAVVRLDGQPAALVVHPAGADAPAGTRLVQAWSCDGRTLLASAHVPVG